MKIDETMIVVGGGYAGIHVIEAIKKEFHREMKKNLRVILVDKNAFHFKKVKLFKGIVNEDVSDLHVPLTHYCGSVIEFIEGELTAVDPEEQKIKITCKSGDAIYLDYDRLILALGSVMRDIQAKSGGIQLNSLKSTRYIRQNLLEQMDSPKPKLQVAIVGSGITGIETATEVSSWIKADMLKKGFTPKNVEVVLINDKQRLICEAPAKISEQLQNRLMKQGIHVLHNKKANKFIDGKVLFNDNSNLEADVCVWTVGLKPHPCLADLGLSLTEDGKVKADSFYRLIGCKNIYSIGDCVQAVDPISGKAAGMSCKEAISQAQRLVKIIKADIQGIETNAHQNYPDFLCIGLGPHDGFVWTQKWGMNFVLTGRLAQKIREYTWDLASLMN
ncbi:NAD(P)/FAD-dependent oxidoreductase [Bacillus sp. M6-12]|uniref:NAD(P)/FAD-dependent oxidoreductase n=1 Tax=Bacillus sp. M6-12 TaxID=2054166 RepID=UPI0015E0C6A0|nr:FAD-dependent oxidoreductase [Bacillus sp. M6-12]